MKDGLMTGKYFADTYALFEITRGNPAYKQYAQADLIICPLNLAEFYYHLLREKPEHAEEYYALYAGSAVGVSLSCIRGAMLFRFAHKQEDLSYIDCIGYALAQELGLKFLTGDKKFKDKKNVEYAA
ncbi:PIN domain-containing protein [Candidatus Woesearchaeota archaeon]|nr:PIN domain-containing protein [Candidatus Woesearchaeota archaeon]HIH38806.1 type II toxin-antitoxin system VapC family toxin [Candidatus Woesearchaeota archaeon]HIH49221.1 type II toxin-antitoxin system VapC family toxin [Candidatus Woesearchaeota archaeon]